MRPRLNGVVPIAVKVVPTEVDAGESALLTLTPLDISGCSIGDAPGAPCSDWVLVLGLGRARIGDVLGLGTHASRAPGAPDWGRGAPDWGRCSGLGTHASGAPGAPCSGLGTHASCSGLGTCSGLGAPDWGRTLLVLRGSVLRIGDARFSCSGCSVLRIGDARF